MPAIEIMDHTLELRLVAAVPSTVIDEVDHDRLGQAVQDGVDQICRLVVEGHIGLGLELLENRFEHPPMPAGVRRRSRPRRNRPLVEGLGSVGNDQQRIDLHRHTEAGAIGASAVRRVEGERARFDLAQREHVPRTGQLLGENQVVVCVQRPDSHDAVAQTQGLLDRIG